MAVPSTHSPSPPPPPRRDTTTSKHSNFPPGVKGNSFGWIQGLWARRTELRTHQTGVICKTKHQPHNTIRSCNAVICRNRTNTAPLHRVWARRFKANAARFRFSPCRAHHPAGRGGRQAKMTCSTPSRVCAIRDLPSDRRHGRGDRGGKATPLPTAVASCFFSPFLTASAGRTDRQAARAGVGWIT